MAPSQSLNEGLAVVPGAQTKAAPAVPTNGPRIVIALDPVSKQLYIDAPLDNWPLCFDMLDAAKDLIKRQHSQRIAQQGIVAVPAGALDQLRAAPKA